MGLLADANVDVLERIEAVGQLRLVLVAQLALAPIAAQLVDGRKVVAIDGPIIIAVLPELGHVVLDGVGRAVRIVHAVGIGCRKMNIHKIYESTIKGKGLALTFLRLGTLVSQGQLAAIGPVGPGDAKQSTNSTAAETGLVASTCGLADASQTHISHRLICFGLKDHSNQISSVQFAD